MGGQSGLKSGVVWCGMVVWCGSVEHGDVAVWGMVVWQCGVEWCGVAVWLYGVVRGSVR